MLSTYIFTTYTNIYTIFNNERYKRHFNNYFTQFYFN